METGIGKNITTTLIITFVKAPLLNISLISKLFAEEKSQNFWKFRKQYITGNTTLFLKRNIN